MVLGYSTFGWLAGKKYERVRDADVLGWLAVFVWVVLDDFISSTLRIVLIAAKLCQRRDSDDSNYFVVFWLHCANQVDI